MHLFNTCLTNKSFVIPSDYSGGLKRSFDNPARIEEVHIYMVRVIDKLRKAVLEEINDFKVSDADYSDYVSHVNNRFDNLVRVLDSRFDLIRYSLFNNESNIWTSDSLGTYLVPWEGSRIMNEAVVSKLRAEVAKKEMVKMILLQCVDRGVSTPERLREIADSNIS